MLSEVYFIPSLQSNIISLRQLAEEGNEVVLHGAFLWVYDRNDVLLIKFERSCNRLYTVNLETCKPVCIAVSLVEAV